MKDERRLSPGSSLPSSFRKSAPLELLLAEHDLPRLVVVRRLVRGLRLRQHLYPALDGRPGIDLVEPTLDVGILREVHAALVGAAHPRKDGDVRYRIFLAGGI